MTYGFWARVREDPIHFFLVVGPLRGGGEPLREKILFLFVKNKLPNLHEPLSSRGRYPDLSGPTTKEPFFYVCLP